MRFVLVSDTHGLHEQMPPIPDGDVLLHAGDLTSRGTLQQIASALDWFAGLPHRHKVLIAGNHDFAFEAEPRVAESLVPPGVSYLRDAGITLDGVRVWGSPWQPVFFNWAFNLPRGASLARVWAQIPADTQVLITHGPPHGMHDVTVGFQPEHVGCRDLRERIAALHDLRLHVFGHIHEGYGASSQDGCHFVNASTTTVAYQPINAPVVLDLAL